MNVRSLPCLGDLLEVGLVCQLLIAKSIKWTYLVVVLGTGFLVLGLDLGELDLHVVVAGGQRELSVGRGQRPSDRGIKEKKGKEGRVLTRQRSSSGHRQPSSHR